MRFNTLFAKLIKIAIPPVVIAVLTMGPLRYYVKKETVNYLNITHSLQSLSNEAYTTSTYVLRFITKDLNDPKFYKTQSSQSLEGIKEQEKKIVEMSSNLLSDQSLTTESKNKLKAFNTGYESYLNEFAEL